MNAFGGKGSFNIPGLQGFTSIGILSFVEWVFTDKPKIASVLFDDEQSDILILEFRHDFS